MRTVRSATACLCFFLITWCAAFSQGTWDRIAVPVTQNLYSVCFVDSLYGWAVGDSGMIIHTSDGGISWTRQESPTENEIANVFFLDRNLGWASSFNFTTPPYGTLILKTSNGGADWTATPYPQENSFINCILFFDSLTGWMGGMPHALVKTTDGGISWTQAAIDTSIFAFFPVLSITFLDDQVGFACGGMFDIAGVIWRTTNGGDLWYAIEASQAPADEVHALHIIDPLHVLGAGGDPDYGYGVGMIRTSDGGLNWAYEDIGIQGIAFDLDFRNDTEAWAPLGPRRKLIYSLNAGAGWTEISTPDSTSILDITFPDTLHGYAVGAGGAVLKYTPPVPPFVPPLPGEKNGCTLSQNYPNPFRSITNYELRITNYSFVSLKIYSLWGEEVATVMEKKLPPGTHQVAFDTGNLPAGIYLYRLAVDGTIQATKRMVVLR
ncbi:MAG: YCF48-related protein [bacterium]